jgi:hypothetical protein
MTKDKYAEQETKCPRYSMICINLWKHCNMVCRQRLKIKNKQKTNKRRYDLDLESRRRAYEMEMTWWRYVPSTEGLLKSLWFWAVWNTLTWLQNNFNQSPRSANDLDLELGRWSITRHQNNDVTSHIRHTTSFTNHSNTTSNLSVKAQSHDESL